MKNLKRVLSLALATVMLLGIMVIGANAAFNDQDDIKYDTAVDTLVALKVIDGMGGNNFVPNGTLTRAQAAKMVAFVKAGANTTVIGYYDGATKFEDVTANHAWATGSINYCVATGIIAGKSATTFAPDDTLTGAELAKMLLVALGYKADTTNKSEALVGGNWANNAITMALAEGLFDGMDSSFVATKAITREEACQMIYNALDTNTKTVFTALDGFYTYNNGNKLIVDAFKATVTSEDKHDDFGRPATEYAIPGKDPILVVESPVLTYTAPVTESALFNALKLTGTTKAVNLIVDGYDAAGTTTIEKSDVDPTHALGGNGVTTEVFKDAAGNVTVVEIANYLAKVTKVNEYKAATATTLEQKASVVLTVYNVNGSDVANKTFETETKFAVGDMVVVTLSTTASDYATFAVESAVAAGSFEGIMTKYVTGVNVTVGGTAHALGRVYTAGDMYVAPANIGFTDTYTYYTDANGAVLGAAQKTAVIPTDYVYVINTEFKLGSAGSLVSNSANAAKANVLFTDGTKSVIDLAIDNKETPATLTDDTVMFPYNDGSVNARTINDIAGTYSQGNWFAYVKNADGTYTLSALNNTYARVDDSVTLSANKTTEIGSGYFTNASTKVTAFAATTYAMSTSTGYPVADKALTGNVLYTYAKDSKIVTGLYAVNTSLVAEDVTYAYAIKAGETVANGVEWIFAIDGKQVTYVMENTPTANHVYTLEAGTKEGTMKTKNDVATVTGTEVTVADPTFFVAGSTYTYAKDAAVYNIDANSATVVGEADTIEVGDTVYVIATSGVASVVYIVTAK